MMIFRTLFALAVAILSCGALCSNAQPADVRMDMKDRVLDLLFPLDTASSPYLSKIIMRFGDSDTQLVVLTYPAYPAHPGGRAELITYSIAGTGDGNLAQFISKMVAQNPKITDREIASKLKVDVGRTPIAYGALTSYIDELAAIRIPPILASRVAVDEYSKYEFWYDGGQESVHFVLAGPFHDAPQDELVKWMIRFRAGVPELTKAASAKS
jgi:hypothetical protein